MSNHLPPLDHGDDMREGYAYSMSGPGVRLDLVDAALEAWGRLTPSGDPATTLRSVNDGAINKVANIARVTAIAVAVAIERNPGPGTSADDNTPRT